MLCSCSSKPAHSVAPAATVATEDRGAFSADSAFAFAQKQVEFGPRVPGTATHDRCTQWLAATLERYGADTVAISNGSIQAWNGDQLPIKNVFAQFGKDKNERIILLAHYDTRPWADYDPDANNRQTPIDGANDGASGVAVLLEIARNLSLEAAQVGVDILLTDCEDYGLHAEVNLRNSDGTWCLGSRYFAENLPYSAAKLPRYGILLDMVGNAGARFNQEFFSAQAAQTPTAKVWAMAKRLGLEKHFPAATGGAVTDDHLPLIAAGIPTTDIIENNHPQTGAFAPTRHTLADNIDHLDAATLGIVGRVVLNVVYNEKP